jgi:hypothetical protein
MGGPVDGGAPGMGDNQAVTRLLPRSMRASSRMAVGKLRDMYFQCVGKQNPFLFVANMENSMKFCFILPVGHIEIHDHDIDLFGKLYILKRSEWVPVLVNVRIRISFSIL